jgi:hypothetical protein
VFGLVYLLVIFPVVENEKVKVDPSPRFDANFISPFRPLAIY